jgi:hypothetical protein
MLFRLPEDRIALLLRQVQPVHVDVGPNGAFGSVG